MRNMRSTNTAWVWITALMLAFSANAGAAVGPLVRTGDAGKYEPGLVSTWTEQANGILLTLAPDVAAAEVTTLLGERIAGVVVKQRGEHELFVTGMSLPTLLGHLSRLALGGSVDPLADITGLDGSVVAMQRPEAGGSIRASRPSELPVAATGGAPSVEPTEAKVVEVQRGEFPHVRLKLKVLRSASTGELRAKLRRGTTFEASVLLDSTNGTVDFTRAENQTNLAGYFLLVGDFVRATVAERDGQLVIQRIERRAAK